MSKQYRFDDIAALVRIPVNAEIGSWSTSRHHDIRNLFIIATIAIIARSSALFLSAIDWDEGVYVVMAQQWLNGNLPYIAVWDQHPPGLPALLVAAQALIHDPVVSARLLGTLSVIVTASVIYRFGTRYLQRPQFALVGSLLYVVCISRFGGLALNTELVNSAIVPGASYLLLTASEELERGIPRALIAGLLFGVGLQIKYVVLPEAVFICLSYLFFVAARGMSLPKILATALALAVVGLLPTAIAVGYFWNHGILDAFLDANLRANIDYLSVKPHLATSVWDSLSGLVPLAGPVALMAYAILFRPAPTSGRAVMGGLEVWMIVWITAAALDICLPMKFYPHYFFALYPAVCLAGVQSLDLITRTTRKSWAIGCVVLFMAALPLWSAGMLRAANARDIPRAFAQLIRESDAAGASVYVYNYQPVIYALAEVKPPSRFVIQAELAQFTQSANVDGRAEVDRIMQTKPVFLVVKDHVAGSDADPLIDVLNPYLPLYEVASDLQEANGEHVKLYRKLKSS
jgi:hypothetical protein